MVSLINLKYLFSHQFLIFVLDNKSLSYELLSELISKNDRRRELHQKITASWIRSKIPWLLYPLAMALLVTTTGITCAIVFFNLSTRLLKLNDSTRGQQFVLGIASISKMGIVGAIFQTLLIIYIGIATLVGMYNLPILGLLQPIRGKTPYIKIMLNCMVVLILSSALPLFTRTVGITNFDLFGNFGQIVWTQNHHLVLFYNCAFLVALSICLCHSVVVKLSKEFFSRLHRFLLYLNRVFQDFHQKMRNIRERWKTSSSSLSLLSFSVSSFKLSSMFHNTLHSSVTFIYSLLHLRTATTSPIKEVAKKGD